MTADPTEPASPATTSPDPGGPQPFTGLGPEQVLDALESVGLACDGRLQALNSFENRVYLVGLDDGESRVVKFYRPGRWTDDQLHEEHAFARELVEAEIPVVAPIAFDGTRTLLEAGGYRLAIFPRQGGRIPELDNARFGAERRDRIGQFIARIHTVGARRPFRHRPSLDVQTHGLRPVEVITDSGLLPDDVAASWTTIANACTAAIGEQLARQPVAPRLRLHGDCHLGNLLWTEGGPHFVDLDDARNGPAIQDLWMLADAGSDGRNHHGLASPEMEELLTGYERIRDLDRRDLRLVETLRTMRMLHYSAWIAERWQDPAFPTAFPWFGTARYWQDQIHALREQLERLTTTDDA